MASIGFTCTLSVNDGAANAQAVVNEVTMITFPARETTTVDVSYLGMASPDKIFVGGLTDNGVCDFECNYTAVEYTRLIALLGKVKHTSRIPAVGTAVTWKITAPDEDGSGGTAAQTLTFNGILTKLDMSVEAEAPMKIKGSIKVSGAITMAP